MGCKICGSDKVSIFDRAIILDKYEVTYYKCNKCGFICTEKPYWLNEAYSDAIADSDIGLLGRNLCFAQLTENIFNISLKNVTSFLDCGGGYGIFVRLMRDKGFDFEWYDKYCENLFAKGHEKKREHYDVVTAFELFEHLPDPIQELQQIMDLGDNIVFSTQLVPKDVGRVSDWWYFSTRTGQHVSFYTANSLEFLANKNGKKYYNVGAGLHLFATQKVSKWLLKLCVRRPGLVNKVMNRIHRRKSLIGEDYYKITGQRI